MANYGKSVRTMPHCLECGEQIRYGRTDKKFCCEECKIKHHNGSAKVSRALKRRIVSVLMRNYEILDALVRSGVSSAELTDVVVRGFVPDMVTAYRKVRSHDEFSCFDIKYYMSSSRIFNISKIRNVSLPLHPGME